MYPDLVTFWNWLELGQAVINRPHIFLCEWVWFVGIVLYTCSYCYMCSATHVQNEDGSLILLRNNERQRRALAKSLLSNEKLNSDKVPKKVSCSTCKHVHVHF